MRISDWSSDVCSSDLAARVADAFHAEFGDAAREAQRASASEDFSEFGRAWNAPYVFWFVGGADPAAYPPARTDGTVRPHPTNPSPRFAPGPEPAFQLLGRLAHAQDGEGRRRER